MVRYEIRGDTVVLEAECEPTGTFRTTESDLFEALCRFRRALERKGYLLLCNGARRDAFPSAMARDMGKGTKVYLNRLGEPGRDLVETLGPAKYEQVSSVEDQADFHKKWFDSLRDL